MDSTRRSRLLLPTAANVLALLSALTGLTVLAGLPVPGGSALSSPDPLSRADLAVAAASSLSITTFLPLVSGCPPYSAALIDGPWSGLPSGSGPGVALDSPRSALTLQSDPTRLVFVARPDASATGYANSVWDLGAYNGRLYLGYGDASNNRGPVDIVSYDPATGALTSEMPDVPEEQLGGWYAAADGRFYAGGIDGQEDWTFGNLYVNDGVAWSKLRTIPRGVHICRVVSFAGRLFADYAASQSSPVPYIDALVSSDLGATWTHERLDDNPGPRPLVIDNLEIVRHSTGEYLYAVYVMDQDSPAEVRRLYRFDGAAWTRVVISDPLGEFLPQRMLAFRNQLLVAGYVRNTGTGYRRNAVYALDGQTQREVGFLLGKYVPCEYCDVNAGTLYCVFQQPWTGDPVPAYTLCRTSDLKAWATLAASVTLQPGAFPRSLSFAADRLYVGATNGGWQQINPGIIDLSPALVYTIENATLEWDADVPEGTAVSLRLRTSANDYGALYAKGFVGPDGTFGTAFETSGQTLHSMHTGDTLLQVTVHRATYAGGPWPTVRSVTLRGSHGSVTLAVDEGTGLYAAANLRESAWYTSTVYRLQEPIASGSLGFDATLPPSTTVRFQVRSAARESQVAQSPFVGPDGRSGTFYESNGQALWAGHDGHLLLQYRVERASSNPVLAPFLRQVVLITRSDRLHHLTVGMDPSTPWLAGELHPITVTAHLADGSLSPISGQVALSARGSGQPYPMAIHPTEVTLVRGTGTTSVLMELARRPLICATLGSLSGCSDVFQVGHGSVPVALALTTDLTSPAPNWSPVAHVGLPFALTVTIQDRYHNQVRSYGGTVRCDLWDRTALSQVVAPYTFSREDSGAHRFDLAVGQSGE